MRDGWRQVRLGELFQTTNRRLGVHDEEPEVFSVTKRDGVVRAAEYFDKRVASAKLDTYKVLADGEWAYSTIHIDEGSIARNRLRGYGVVSPMYTTMKLVSGDALPFFCELALRTPEMLARYKDAQQGSIDRRRSLPWKVFGTLTLNLPPLDEQRRIVDLVTAVDAAIDAALRSLSAAEASLASLRRLTGEGGWRPLGQVVEMRSGPSWDKSREHPESAEGRSPVLGITNTPPGLALDLRTAKFVDDLPPSTMRLAENSLVMIRTNGNRGRIGNIYRATALVAGFAVSAFQIAIEPHEPADAAFLYWFIGSPEVQSEISQNASGSTGLGNVAVRWLKELPVPTLSETAQRDYVARCEAAGQVVHKAQGELDGLRRLRSTLLSALLSGEHEIPGSYDELLAG